MFAKGSAAFAQNDNSNSILNVLFFDELTGETETSDSSIVQPDDTIENDQIRDVAPSVAGSPKAANVEPTATNQSEESSTKSDVTPTLDTIDSNSETTATTLAPKNPGKSYGLWVLSPALVAIIIAILTRQVLIALPLGILTASFMMLNLQGAPNPIHVLTHAIDTYLFDVLAPVKDGNVDFNHLKILVFTLLIGSMIGAVEASGGTREMVARVTRHLKNRSRGQLGAWFAGILVFLDDYANAMIVGPSMRPVFDRLKISREKLAYIVDSTAAPVASVFIGTWLVAEIGFIQKGLDALGADRPAFLADMNGTLAFWASLPYRTYAWLAIAMVFFIGWTGRDFGSMKTAEQRALNTPDDPQLSAVDNDHVTGSRWWLGVIPIASMVIATIALLIITGYRGFIGDGGKASFDNWDAIVKTTGDILYNASADDSLLYAALIGTLIALALGLLSRACTLEKAMNGVSDGMQRMFAACVVLTLAWGLAQGTQDLELSKVAAETLRDLQGRGVFDITLLPAATFVTAAIVAFATGTSWGTMGILCPAVVAIAARLYDAPMPQDQAMMLFYATIGAVLTGAVFGDHCSPISDTTVMSSIASECDLGKHVWTQMPYAIVVALVGLLTTDVFNFALIKYAPEAHDALGGWTVYLGTALGALLLLIIVVLIGRKPKATIAAAEI